MKYILLLVIISFVLLNQSQNTIYVESIKDKRYISYKDSLNKYYTNKKYKKWLIAKLETANDLWQYRRMTDSLGYGTTDLPVTKDGQYMYTNKKKTCIDYELVTAFHSMKGDLSPLYRYIVPKPKIIVYIYKPNPPIILKDTCEFNIRYETIIGDKHYTDSTKIITYIKN